ncbi:glycosyltransferase [Agromyces albus]|uniref:Glycosyltransferase family 4 protein n=1 Tax=Agromyces albus TaxID=205332 RepID=A0A4Q2L6D7_9MICO|nr:glycosyltransferase [Agromyces albus]RXZ71992.1 glycosyltransferase family 4 protein [Agromyces albus]
MRIGIIAPPWLPIPPPAYGGIESFVDTLARALSEAGHDVLLAASLDSTCPVPRLSGFQPSDPKTMGITAFELRHLIRAYAALTDVDVIVDNTLAGPVVAASRSGAAPIVAIAHGPFMPMIHEIYRAASPDVSFVAISQHQASMAGPVRIARVIHHGIHVEEIPRGHGGTSACFVGRMHPAKGLPEAIRTAALAGIHLRIAAKMRESTECAYFEEMVRPALGSNAEYLGELSREEKYALMGESCALVNPIQWDEPFGLVMIEALATGTPVVATPHGSVPELIEESRTGFIRSTPEQLALALQRVSSLDRELCRATVEKRFAAARMAADYVALFTQVLQRQPRLDTPGAKRPSTVRLPVGHAGPAAPTATTSEPTSRTA